MKKSALLVAAIIAAVASLTSCGGSDKGEGKGKDSTPVKPAVEGTTNIRWYDLDSVSNNYKLVELLNSEAEAAMNSYQSFARQKSSEIAALQKKIETRCATTATCRRRATTMTCATIRTRPTAPRTP